jgi:ABC-type multidrug transport system ATPase subunit
VRWRLSTSTPEALWSGPSLRVLRPLAVVCRDVHRSVRGRPLLNGLTLSVPVGMRLLVVSRPDETASLFVRAIAGLARIGSGRIEVAGLPHDRPEVLAGRVAHIGPRTGLYPWMSPREALTLAARLAGLEGDPAEARIASVIRSCRLEPAMLDRAMARGGRRGMQRLAFAVALIGAPEVLVLDDPFAALVPAERGTLLELLGPRQTVLLASRDVAGDIAAFDHLALLRHGRLGLLAPVAELRRRGLPPSVEGIEALAAARAAGRQPRVVPASGTVAGD